MFLSWVILRCASWTVNRVEAREFVRVLGLLNPRCACTFYNTCCALATDVVRAFSCWIAVARTKHRRLLIRLLACQAIRRHVIVLGAAPDFAMRSIRRASASKAWRIQ